MSMEHIDNYANKGYSFKEIKYTRDKLIEIIDYSNMSKNDYLDMVQYQDIDDEIILSHFDQFKPYLKLYSECHKMGDDIIKYLYDNGLFDNTVTKRQYLSDSIIDYIIGDDINTKQDFINTLLKTQQVSDDNLIRFTGVADYSIMFKYQKISEELTNYIESISTKDDKYVIFTTGALYQWWSDEYVVNHADYIHWFRYYIYPERVRIPYTKMEYFLPDDPNGYYPDNIEWPILTDEADPRLLNVNNKHVPVEYWRKLIGAQFNVYSHDNNYFIGYLITTSDNYSIYDYKLLYINGAVVEKHADITETQNSFGINLKSLDELTHLSHDYIVGDGMVVKKIKLVKVLYSDVCCAYKTPEGYTIRVKKVEVIRDYEP